MSPRFLSERNRSYARNSAVSSWRFAVRGSAEGWGRLWQPVPEPGWHDLLALKRRGAVVLEGDLQPLMANLQYVKDLLVLPRRIFAEPK